MTNYISRIRTKGKNLAIGGDNFDGQWVQSIPTICSGVTLAAKAQSVYDISSHIPNDGYDYELYVMLTFRCPALAGQSASVYLYSGSSTSDYDYTAGAVGLVVTRHNVLQEVAQFAFIPVKANRKKLVLYNGHGHPADGLNLYFKGYRRIGKNGTHSNYISNVQMRKNTIKIGGDNFDGQWVRKGLDICTNLSLANGASASYDISSYIPNDGNTYELMIKGWGNTGSTAGNSIRYKVITNTDYYISGARATTGATALCGGGCTAMIDGTTRSISVINTGNATANIGRCRLIGYRKLGKNKDSNQYLSKLAIGNEAINIGGDNFDGQWIYKGYCPYEWTSLASGTTKAVDISSYIPNDGYAYELMVYAWINTGTTSGNAAEVYVGTDLTDYMMLCRANTRAASSVSTSGVNKIVISGKSRTLNILNGAGATSGSGRVWLSAYRRLGTNT